MGIFNTTDGTIIKNLFIPSARTSNYGLKQLGVVAPRIWNALPSHLKNETPLHVFWKNLKLYFIFTYSPLFSPPTHIFLYMYI